MLSNKGKPMSYTTLSKTYSKLGNVINISLSIRCNRHIKATERIDIMAIEEVANELGHSIEECISVYVKKR